MSAPTASWLPSDRTAHVLAQMLAGMPLNGTDPTTLDPLWRGVVLRIGAGSCWDDELEFIGLSDGERQALGRQIAGVDVSNGKTPDPPRPLLRFLRGPELRNLPPLEWLVKGIIPKSSTVALYGPPSTGKSFLMLHMACHLAMGWKWYGRETTPGPVIYFAAEGQMGVKQRYIAWCDHYNGGRDVPGFILCPQPMYPTVDEFAQALYGYVDGIVGEKPVMVVFDTLFRCFEGDENGTADMGKFIRATDAIRARMDTTIGLVHHTGWNVSRMRGNSALLGALDVAMRTDRDDLGTICLSCEKMKDAETFSPWYFDLTPVPGTESVVATLAQDNKPGPNSVLTVPDTHMPALMAVVGGGTTGVAFSSIKKESGITRDPTLSAILTDLQHGGFIRGEGEVGARGRLYVATPKGRLASAPRFGSASEVTGSGENNDPGAG